MRFMRWQTWRCGMRVCLSDWGNAAGEFIGQTGISGLAMNENYQQFLMNIMKNLWVKFTMKLYSFAKDLYFNILNIYYFLKKLPLKAMITQAFTRRYSLRDFKLLYNYCKIIGKKLPSLSNMLLVSVAIIGLLIVYGNKVGYDNQSLLGIFLLIGMAIQTIYGIKKRYGALPLPNAKDWKYLHVMTGLIWLIIFYFHVFNNRSLNFMGYLIIIFAMIICISGIIQEIINRFLPKLAINNHELLSYNQIYTEKYFIHQEFFKYYERLKLIKKAENIVELFASNYVDYFGKFQFNQRAYRRNLDIINELIRVFGDEFHQELHAIKILIENKNILNNTHVFYFIMRFFYKIHALFVPSLWAIIIFHVWKYILFTEVGYK